MRPDDLATVPIKAVVEQAGVPPAEIDDVIHGCAGGAGEDNRNVARMALLLAGLPVEVPGMTINRLCVSVLPCSWWLARPRRSRLARAISLLPAAWRA